MSSDDSTHPVADDTLLQACLDYTSSELPANPRPRTPLPTIQFQVTARRLQVVAMGYGIRCFAGLSR